MLPLIAASLLWAFSFGLIKSRLAGLDPWAVTFWRLALAALVLAPWTWRQRPGRGVAAVALGLGALQFGLMYVFYVASFQYLPAYGVALWTIFTPLYVVVIEGARRRRLSPRESGAALLAVAGGAVVLAQGGSAASWPGVLLVQGSNICFAAGQLGYRRLARRTASASGLIGWMYLGATILAAVGLVVAGKNVTDGLDSDAWPVLVYLGLVPTAAGFALWNLGASRTKCGMLAVVNNLKIPLAVLVSWFVFGERADRWRILAGLGLMVCALFVVRPRPAKE